jgi:hypothetical protein
MFMSFCKSYICGEIKTTSSYEMVAAFQFRIFRSTVNLKIKT